MALHHDTYIDGLILRDGNPLMWQYDGGYVALNASAAPTSWNYYISNHLGSTRMVVTNINTIKETINYYPYGSEMKMTDPAQMTSMSNKERFRFSGKELDFQNGLNMYDFGARMFDVAGVPIWTSVDPLAEDNRHVTPYSYCNGDPVNRFDPDGRDNFRLNRDGNIDLIEETADDYNLIYSVDKNGICNLNNPFVASSSFFANTTSTTLKGKASEEFGGGVCEYNVTIYSNTNNTESANFFEFASNNTDVEWSYVETSSYSSVGTSHSQGDDVSNAYMMYNAARNNIPVIRNIHSHSLGNNIPSYGDIYFAEQYSQQPLNAPDAQFYIYDRAGYHSYDKNSSVMPPEIVITGSRRKQK